MVRLSNPQKLIYDMEKYAGGTVAIVCGSVLLEGEKEPADLIQAVNAIFRCNDALRTRIIEQEGKVSQEVENFQERTINVLQFDSKDALTAFAEEYAKIPIAFNAPLCEIQIVLLPEHYGLLTKCHHIIGDAWTLTLIASQFCALLRGEEPQAYPYADFVESEAVYVQGDRREKDKAFFLEQFKTCPEAVYLSEKPGDCYNACRSTFQVNADLTSKLRAYTKEHHTSPFTLFLTVFAVYFSRVKDNVEYFYIGTPILNRKTSREKHTMGMFVNTVPALAHVDYKCSFVENLGAMQAETLAVLRHQKFHYNEILTAIRQEYDFTEKLYDVILSYQNAAVTGAEHEVETTWYHSGMQTESLQIHIDDRDGKGVFCIHLDYRTDKFTNSEIQRMCGHILNLLQDAVSHGGKTPEELALLSPEEEQLLLRDFNDTAADYPRDKCVHTLFEEQVERTPDKVALVFGNCTFSYKELNCLSNGFAWKLKHRGIERGDVVAILAKRSYKMVVAILAILKAGGVYLPIDYNYPSERIDEIIHDSNCKAVFTYGVEYPGKNVIRLEEELYRETNLENINKVKDVCAVIYTSGSTGHPKGTLICHQGLTNYTYANDALYTGCSCVLGFSIYTFDAFFLDTIAPMLRGIPSVIATEAQQFQQTYFEKLIFKNPNCNLFITPAKLKVFLDNCLDTHFFDNVHSVCIGGEVFPKEFLNLLPDSTNIHNVYGPTECSMWTLEANVIDTDITIGKPIANTQIYIVDKYMVPVPMGVTGELCIAGDGVGAGYLNRPELTAEKFVPNPFGGGKLYKTGDLAYWREDGNIVYVGRNDFQVKIRGLRVELGEIENTIAGVDGVSQAVVVVRKNEAGRQLICAFYTETAPVELETIKSALREKLPRYMMPHFFTRLDALPMTTSGKVNRKALPEVDLSVLVSEVEYVAPVTEQETTLVSAVAQVLNLEKVGIEDNFFDLGGDSLKAIELTSVLERAGYHAEVKTIFEAGNLGELAAKLVTAHTEAEIELPAGDIPATAAQMRVYTAQSISGGTAYNVPYAFRVKELDSQRLQSAVDCLVARYEILRTRFENQDGIIMQIVDNSARCQVEKLSSDDFSAFICPFDLETAPLLRVGYCGNTILLDMHHIITDGGSMPIFLRELNALYMGRDLADTPVQYRAFAAQAKVRPEDEAYWLSVFADEPPALEMNTDYPRPNKQNFEGTAIYQSIPAVLHEKVCSKSTAMNVTPYTYYIGAYYILLSKFSGNEDIVIGTPASGRRGKFLDTLGMFVNTLALRGRPEGTKIARDFLSEVKTAVVGALAHQDYSYGDLVKKLEIHPEGRNPLFDIMFAYQNEEMTQVSFGDTPAELLPVPVTSSKYDFTFNVMPRKEGVVLMVEYCTALFKETTIRRLIEGYELLLEQMLDETKLLKDLTAITEQERQTLLYAFNDTVINYPRNKCVHTLFEEQVECTPNKTAVIACDRTLTYQELNEEANCIAHGLIKKGVKPGEIVAFALPRDSHLIPTMFGILKAGAAYLPIDPDYPQERIDYMLLDSGARVFVTAEELPQLIENEDSSNPALVLSSESLCYCIYTSGSTGSPKGTLLVHRGIVNLVTNLKIYSDLTQCNRFGFTTTITFDVATQEILTALLNGFTGVLLPERRETAFDEITRTVEINKVDVIYATSTYFDSLTEEKNRAQKLFSTLKVVCLAGEKFILNKNVHNLKKQFDVIFENQYGPVELHVIAVSTTQREDDFDSIGKPIANNSAYILDKYLSPVPIGITGELCIAGDGVGAGYLNRPELTAEKFIPNPFGPGKLYKTGDLAYWREDGNIVYVGRNDFQVKIRGLRVELGEIENIIAGVDGISQAVVVVRKNETGRQLICAFYTETVPVELETIKSALRKKLPRYMMPHIFTRLDAMPMTTSGKVNRKALPEVDLSVLVSEVEYVAPVTEQETALASAVAQVLNLEKVGIEDNFFDLGGDSLKAIELTSVLERAGYHVEVKTIFEAKNLGEVAAKLVAVHAEAETELPAGDIPATDAQMRVYTAQSISGGTNYNVPYAFRVKELDFQRLQSAVDCLVARYEILRTRFENRDGIIMQVVDNSARCQVEKLSSDDLSAFICSFDLETAPLLRVGYCGNMVLLDMHHIITDGGSMPIFLRELNELYMGRDLVDTPVQYRAFAAQVKVRPEDETYWLSVFADEPPILEMNTDYPRQSKQNFEGTAIYQSIPAALHEKVCSKSTAMNVTPYAYYIGAYYILLSKFSGNEDIVIGTPASGRRGKFLDTLGMFVNTLALRGRPEGTKIVRDFLSEVKTAVVGALAHQDYPYGDLVKKLEIHPEGRNPLFDVMFAYQSEEMTQVSFGDTPAELLPVPVTSSKYDFTFNVMPRKEGVVLMVEYCTALFKETTIRRLIEGYELLLEQMLDETKLLKDLTAITEQEQQTLLYSFNDTVVDYPRDKCVHTLFEEQVERTPDKTAVIACDRTLTYRELNEEANRIAHGLMKKGVRPGDIVAFALPRDSHLIPAMFGILKVGAAYLPIDPDYPQKRINYMLLDSGAKALVTEKELHVLRDNQHVENLNLKVSSENLCYCIYTSGSTGKPKGLLICHNNVVNFCCNNSDFHSSIKTCCDFVLASNDIVFDITLQEIHLPLTNGKGVFMTKNNIAISPDEATQLRTIGNKLAIITTPTKMSLLLTNTEMQSVLKNCRTIMLGAETFSPELYQKIKAKTNAKIFNGYGPTETTCGTCYKKITSTNIAIGVPIANTQIYIVDKYMIPVPIGVTGELCIAGDGVGAGYLNKPELTAEKFIPNPFGPGKLYKTGDLAYWREDGNIVYVGRNDFQVKIRGLRIELGEIENAIAGVDGISQAVVVVRKDDTGRQLICAFYTETNQVELETVKSALREKLPRYMMPHVFTRLDTLPVTTSGKVNRKALPEVDLANPERNAEYLPPEGEIEKQLTTIMEGVLNDSPIGRDDNFFDLGGDSLKAIEFLSKAHSDGLYFSLQNVFDYPTVRQLRQCMEEGDKLNISYEGVDFSQIDKLLAKNRPGRMVLPEQDMGSILLTGSTGFLGIHILADYLEHDTGTAYCLVRGKNQAESERRLGGLLNFYFGSKYTDLLGKRVRVLCGDLQKDNLGLDSQEYKMLLENVNTVINAAASVKHYGSYQYFHEVNVDTVGRLIAFCRSGHAKLIHSSTLSVSGNSFGDDFSGYTSETEKHFFESNLYIGQPLENVYARSKFEAEKLVLEAALDGLPVHIMRMGNLTNRQSDGVFQINHQTNAAAQRIKGIVELGIVPDYLINEDMYVEFTPIDEAAQAIMTLVRHFDPERTVFHINSTKVVYLDKLMEYFTILGYPLRAVPGDEFTAALRETAKQAGMEHIFETFINDMDEQDHLNYDSNIRIKNACTEEYLHRLGFSWGEIGLEYLRKYTEYFRKIGYWEE